MYRWCSHCGETVGRLKPGQESCPRCKKETDVEFDPAHNDTLRIDHRREFRVLQKLSKHADAGMSAVYLVERTDDPSRRAVLKITKVKIELRVLKREVSQLQKLIHPNIISLAYGQHKQTPDEAILTDTKDNQRLYFIALEYMAGGSLKDKQRAQKKFSLEEATDIIIQIAQALDYIHNQEVVHLDVKPANILFSSDGRAVLSDFGVTRAQSVLSQIRGRIGTLLYNAPEQFRPDVVADKRVDIYALGLILYEMLTGQNPVSLDKTTGGTSTLAKKVLRKISEIPPPRQINSKIPVSVERVILKAIAPDRDQRYNSTGEFAKDLRQVVEYHNASRGRVFGQPKWLVYGVGFLSIIALVLFIFAIGMIASLGRPAQSTSRPTATEIAAETAEINEDSEVILGESQVTPTATLVPGETRPPTATLAPGETRRPTSTLSPRSTEKPVPTSTDQTKPTSPPTPQASAQLEEPVILVAPRNEFVLPSKSAEFQWRLGNERNCQALPDGLGFELRIWPDGSHPMGAMDATADQDKIGCQAGIYTYTIGDITMASGVKNSNTDRFRWDVAVVQLNPYKPLHSYQDRIVYLR